MVHVYHYKYGGTYGSRTHLKGFADLRVTVPPTRHVAILYQRSAAMRKSAAIQSEANGAWPSAILIPMNTTTPTTNTNREIIFILFVFAGIYLAGVLFYRHFENLAWVDAVYFTTVTLTTLGYGEITPQTDIGKLFTSVYAFLGVGLFLGVAGIVFQNTLAYSRAHPPRLRKRK